MIHVFGNINSIEEIPFELVERKGIGHPDTLCDAIAEKASLYYSRYFLEHFDRIAHHWFDKVMLIGGCSEIGFGEGELVKPYKVIFAGKAAKKYKGIDIPLDSILTQAAIDVLSSSLTGFDETKHLEIVNEVVDYHGAGRHSSRYQPQSEKELVSLNNLDLVSNDCNLLTGYAPLSNLESLVLKTEQYINGTDFKKNHSETGWDVKIIGFRECQSYKLIINIPFLASKVHNEQEYFSKKSEIQESIEYFINNEFTMSVDVLINPQDKNKNFYLTALGSVADTGDVGVVGRGNRINGLITPMRPMCIEAPAGKNPLDHTGKIYGVLANKLALEIYNQIGSPVEVYIFVAKESTITSPDQVVVKLVDWEKNGESKKLVYDITNAMISNINNITIDFIKTGVTMW